MVTDALQPKGMTFIFVHCYSGYGRSLMVSLQQNLSARKKCFASNVSMSLALSYLCVVLVLYLVSSENHGLRDDNNRAAKLR